MYFFSSILAISVFHRQENRILWTEILHEPVKTQFRKYNIFLLFFGGLLDILKLEISILNRPVAVKTGKSSSTARWDSEITRKIPPTPRRLFGENKLGGQL